MVVSWICSVSGHLADYTKYNIALYHLSLILRIGELDSWADKPYNQLWWLWCWSSKQLHSRGVCTSVSRVYQIEKKLIEYKYIIYCTYSVCILCILLLVNCRRFCFWRCQCAFFACVWNISAKFIRKMCSVPCSDEFEGQGYQGQKMAFFGPFGGLCAA